MDACNTASGVAAETFGKVIDATNTDKQKAKQFRRKTKGRKYKEAMEGTRKITSSVAFQHGGILNETMWDILVAHENNKRRAQEEKDVRAASKRRKTVSEAKALLEMNKGPSDYTIPQLKLLITRSGLKTHL